MKIECYVCNLCKKPITKGNLITTETTSIRRAKPEPNECVGYGRVVAVREMHFCDECYKKLIEEEI